MTTIQSHPTVRPALRQFDVELWPLNACQMRVKARSPSEAKRIASRSWLDGDDITAFMAEPDYWTIEEVLGGR